MRILAPLLLAAALSPATAAVITFDSYQPLDDFSATTVITDGFSFTNSCQCMGVDNQQPQDLGGNPLPGAYNGTASLIYSTDPLTVAAVGGAAFYLDRLELGLSWYVPDDQVGSFITITYDLAAGGQGSVSTALGRSYTSISIGEEVLGFSISGGRSFGYVSLDNLVVNTNQVPEPASAGLALLALLGAAATTRRRRQAST